MPRFTGSVGFSPSNACACVQQRRRSLHALHCDALVSAIRGHGSWGFPGQDWNCSACGVRDAVDHSILASHPFHAPSAPWTLAHFSIPVFSLILSVRRRLQTTWQRRISTGWPRNGTILPTRRGCRSTSPTARLRILHPCYGGHYVASDHSRQREQATDETNPVEAPRSHQCRLPFAHRLGPLCLGRTLGGFSLFCGVEDSPGDGKALTHESHVCTVSSQSRSAPRVRLAS